MNDGDWICGDPNCGNINFARRVSCYRCNKERPDGGKPFKKKLGTEIGKSAAEKSRGLFNADDWQCNKCANVNWARRHTCNVCNAPKFGEVEARTGYGGGYNERGVVEYRRREPSSDDEYDEFGRKKRKRKHEPQDKVGITEGAAFKKLPATMLQNEKLEHIIPGPAPKNMHVNNEREKISGSLSDGSVCELPPLSKMAFRRHQLQSQTNYLRQDHMLPGYKTNGFQPRNFQPRKRYSSTGDRDQTGSSGYDTASKKSKRDSSDSPVKAYDPVMENRVSSTNNDFVYKFTGPTPVEDFQVTYTLEERVRAAALALVYSNCKITTEKFEWLYDKPAPDFKTIFGWRQRLLTTGCLIDGHVDKKDITKQLPVPSETKNKSEITKKVPITRIPNPDEIPIISDTEDEEPDKESQNQNKLSLRKRSVSVETLVIGPNDHETRRGGSSISTSERRSQARSQSDSSHGRSRSSSRDSQDSNYPDTDSEKLGKTTNSKTSATNNKNSLPSRASIHASDSDSISYNSEDENFLSRVYGEGRKVKRKFKKRSTAAPVPAVKPTNYVTNDSHNFQGYSTAKPSMQQTPLVTGNIYTCNLRNMNARNHDNVIDTDGCSSEYIPTRLGSTKNYQEFKNNVRRKGYWAKGNGSTFGKSINISNEPITRNVPNKPRSTYSTSPEGTHMQPQISYNVVSTQNLNSSSSLTTFQNVHNTSGHNVHPNTNNIHNSVSNQKIHNAGDSQNILHINDIKTRPSNRPEMYGLKPQNLPTFKSPMEVYPSPKHNAIPNHHTVTVNRSMNFSAQNVDINEQHLSVDKPAQSTPNGKLDRMPENTSRIFDAVQSNNTSKNRSILDIFMNDEAQSHQSPERNNDLKKYDGIHKMFETSWDEDDDALYKNDSMDEATDIQTPLGTRAQSPISSMLYATDDDQSIQIPQKKFSPIKITPEIIQGKQELLLGLLKDVGEKETAEKSCINIQTQQNKLHTLGPEAIPVELSNEIICMSEEPKNTICQENKPEAIKPSKQIQIIESVTIKPSNNEKRQAQNDGSNTMQETTKPPVMLDQHKVNDLSQDVQNKEVEISAPQPAPVLDLANLLSGINTNTLLLALQNLQQINQVPKDKSPEKEQRDNAENNDEVYHVETINLTNDEEWEKESNNEGSIERELQKLDGNTGDTPFLSDIFDPGPVVLPSNIGRKLNINLKTAEENKQEAHKPHLNEIAPVIGNFKSFALPKPIMLNRLKLTVKPPDRPKKTPNGKKLKRKKKSKASASQGEEEGEDEEEESGDEADLSKYDLWGSDEEQGNSSKTENADKSKEGETSKEGQERADSKNGKPATSPPQKKNSKRSRSSSTSSSSSSSSSSSHSSSQAPKNKFDDFNLNSERETSPRARRSRSPRARAAAAPARRKSRDSRSAGEARSHDKEWSRDRDRRERPRGARDERKERRYSREGGNHYGAHGGRGRHR